MSILSLLPLGFWADTLASHFPERTLFPGFRLKLETLKESTLKEPCSGLLTKNMMMLAVRVNMSDSSMIMHMQRKQALPPSSACEYVCGA